MDTLDFLFDNLGHIWNIQGALHQYQTEINQGDGGLKNF